MTYIPKIFKNPPNENKEEKSGSTKRKRSGSSSLNLNQSSKEMDPQLELEHNSAGTKHSKASEPLHDGDVQQHHEGHDYSCKFCPKKFANKQALGGHQNAHKIEKVIQKRGWQGHEDHFGHPGNNSNNGMTSFAFPNSFNQAPKRMSPPHYPQTMQNQMYAHDYPDFRSPMPHESGVVPGFLSPMSHESGVVPHESGVVPGFLSPMSHESDVVPHESGVNLGFTSPMTRESGVTPGFISSMTCESGVNRRSHESGVIPMSHESRVIPVSRASEVMKLGSFFKSSPSPQFLSFQNRMDQGASTSMGKSSTLAKNDHADNCGPINDAESKKQEDDLDLSLKL